MRIFRVTKHAQAFDAFQQKFHGENKAMSLYGWREAFEKVDPQLFHTTAQKVVSCWPSSLVALFLSLLDGLA